MSIKDTQEYKDYENLLRVDLDDVTLRIRRNLMIVAASIIFIKYFGIKVKGTGYVEIPLEKMTTDIVLNILMIVTFYHFVVFSIRGLEQYWLYRKKITDNLSKINKIRYPAGNSWEDYSIIEAICSKLPSHLNILKNDSRDEVAKKKRAIADYKSKRYLAFSRLWMEVRFWGLDMGLAAALFIWAAWVYFCR